MIAAHSPSLGRTKALSFVSGPQRPFEIEGGSCGTLRYYCFFFSVSSQQLLCAATLATAALRRAVAVSSGHLYGHFAGCGLAVARRVLVRLGRNLDDSSTVYRTREF